MISDGMGFGTPAARDDGVALDGLAGRHLSGNGYAVGDLLHPPLAYDTPSCHGAEGVVRNGQLGQVRGHVKGGMNPGALTFCNYWQILTRSHSQMELTLTSGQLDVEFLLGLIPTGCPSLPL